MRAVGASQPTLLRERVLLRYRAAARRCARCHGHSQDDTRRAWRTLMNVFSLPLSEIYDKARSGRPVALLDDINFVAANWSLPPFKLPPYLHIWSAQFTLYNTCDFLLIAPIFARPCLSCCSTELTLNYEGILYINCAKHTYRTCSHAHSVRMYVHACMNSYTQNIQSHTNIQKRILTLT